MHIEDQVCMLTQVFPKRCGHLDGKELVSVAEMVRKIEVCRLASLEVSGGEFIVCARTDARGVEGIQSVSP